MRGNFGRPYLGHRDSLPPLPHIFWTLWTWGFTGTPRIWAKSEPRNAWKQTSQVLGNFWSFSPPPKSPATSASRPTKVYGWKFTHHRWMSNHYLENQPLFGKPTTLWLEILPPSQPHRYHNSALYILFDKGKVEENSSPWNRPLKDHHHHQHYHHFQNHHHHHVHEVILNSWIMCTLSIHLVEYDW